MELMKLELKDNGKEANIKLDGKELTGVTKYIITRSTECPKLIDLELNLVVELKDIDIKTKNANLK